jgi:Glycosyl hydrolases family 16
MARAAGLLLLSIPESRCAILRTAGLSVVLQRGIHRTFARPWLHWKRHLGDLLVQVERSDVSGNNDQALKADPSFRGTGVPTLAERGLLTHERTVGNTLKLYGRVIPIANRSQYYSFPYVGGMISTERTHAQTYGYWEVRARLTNTSKGHHWAMWLIPQDGSWPPEIDMVEVVGKNPNAFYMNAHGTGKDELARFSPNDPFGWHTWGFLWTQNDLVWYVDGVERKRISNYINKPMYWLMSPEIGSSRAALTTRRSGQWRPRWTM